MHDSLYSQYEAVFLPLAHAKLAELAAELASETGNGFTPIEVLDLGNERGLTFTELDSQGKGTEPFFVKLILAEGDERGYEGVGLILHNHFWKKS